MSEFTYGNLIVNYNKPIIKKYCPMGTAICSLNNNWIAFFTNEDGETTSSPFLERISLESPVLYFYNLSDHCWGYQIWDEGRLSSYLHFSYEFDSELLLSIAQERYPEQEYIASFLFENDEGQRIYKEIEKELSDPVIFEKALKKHFNSVKAQDFTLFGFKEEEIELLVELLSVDTYLDCEDERDIVNDFKRLISIEEMSWYRFERIEQDDEDFEFI
ncbi:hypothetical protein NLX71_13625 [Paenibacillus sp. MZ04-78.2]|uniref:hypothetical protein n=1 Tax=Paenibacillus sp. MZ04-78.2 TaxID=2962034 RepID=UPI0020B70AE8|nr:hypothetical protein [Paenibacillus sp. MZ04-78.2]MCP3774337.1 hypothetical protein [Paenibacillus sp. MZ04-78.2]